MIRNAFLLTLLAVFLVSTSGWAKSEKNVNTQSMQKGSETRVYELFGMDCPGCHGGLEKLVKKILTVQQVKANWKKKQLTVTVKPEAKLNDEEIYDAIRRANFTVGKRIK